MSPRPPAYLALAASGELARRAASAYRHLEDCDLCARYCRVNRRRGIEGAVCRADEYQEIDRPTTTAEYREALDAAARHGLERLDNWQGWALAREEAR